MRVQILQGRQNWYQSKARMRFLAIVVNGNVSRISHRFAEDRKSALFTHPIPVSFEALAWVFPWDVLFETWSYS